MASIIGPLCRGHCTPGQHVVEAQTQARIDSAMYGDKPRKSVGLARSVAVVDWLLLLP
jgi:hypothetical protein